MIISVSDPNNSSVKVNLTHNILNMRIPEVKLDLFQNIESVKKLCARKFGSDELSVQLVLQDQSENSICVLAEDDRVLGYYCPLDNYTIHVIDLNPNSLLKELEDLSQVEKYTMSEEDYDKLPNNFRKFKIEYLKAHPELVKAKNATDAEYMKDAADKIKVEDRCKITDYGHRGTIKYVGKIKEMAEGYFVGIQLDEPFGKNDGSVKGTKYFQCPQNYGLFVRPDRVEVGDFPELDMDDEI